MGSNKRCTICKSTSIKVLPNNLVEVHNVITGLNDTGKACDGSGQFPENAPDGEESAEKLSDTKLTFGFDSNIRGGFDR